MKLETGSILSYTGAFTILIWALLKSFQVI